MGDTNGWARAIEGMRKWNSQDVFNYTSSKWSHEHILEVNRLVLANTDLEDIMVKLRKSKAAVVNKITRLRQKDPSLFSFSVSSSVPLKDQQSDESLWGRAIDGMRLWDVRELSDLESPSWPIQQMLAISKSVIQKKETLAQ